MINFFLTVGFIFLTFFTGYNLAQKFFKETFNKLEKIGASFGLGLIYNFIVGFVLSTLRIPLSPLTILFAFVLINVALLRGRAGWKIRLKIPEIKVDFFPAFLIFLLLIIFSTLFYRAIVLGFVAWDEFSFWGKASRMIFSTRNIFIQSYLTPESSSNPLFWPTNAGMMAVFSGKFVENYIKLLTPTVFASLGLFIFGFLERLKLNLNERLLFTLLYFVSGQVHLLYATTLYADIPLIYFFSISALTSLRTLSESEDFRTLFCALPFFLALVVLKLGGSILSLTVIAAIFLLNIKRAIKKANFKKFFLVASWIILLQGVWAFLSKLAGEAKSSFANKAFENFAYALTVIPQLMYRMIEILNNKFEFNYFWSISGFSLILSFILFKKKLPLAILITSIFYVAYLFIAYITLFTKRELLMLASLERYILPLMPLYLIGLADFYKEALKRLSNNP